MVGIMMMKKQTTSNWWWLDSHSNTRRSPWLQSTLSELDEKTEAMLKLIEEDADSFSKRAEMYYKKRPELIGMVEDFYRAHRSLAERYDQIKSETQPRLLTSQGSPFSSKKARHEKPVMANTIHQNSISYYQYEISDYDESAESEVEDPDEDGGSKALEGETLKVPGEREEAHIARAAIIDWVRREEEEEEEVRKLREEIERLREENRVQRELLGQKDEEKREVIRQLSLAVGMLKEENVRLKKSAIKETKKRDSSKVKNSSNKVNGGFLRKLFGGSFLNSQATVVAL